MRVIGTAGHVDHGKSTLVKALTGTHPDRLKEEREREMTIDLGFAFFDLPDGQEVGIVDVPGHRDFIENMLSGVGGIDAALFVVAADEGVMPQTREHLAILDLLQIPGGLVALTKSDLVRDPDWLELVHEELTLVLDGTTLEDAGIYPVSARTGAGLGALVDGLAEVLSLQPPRPDLGRPRLPIDRSFTISGFGTVVTGTLLDGVLRAGDEVEIMPAGQRARVRGLQSHNRAEPEIGPGSRVAVNLAGVRPDQAPRGSWLAAPGSFAAVRRLDLAFRLLAGASSPLKHNVEVKLFLGAAEVMGRVRILGTERIEPGEDGWIQLELAEPVIARRGDRYILRRPSPPETIGGGTVLDPAPTGRHRRFHPGLVERMSSLADGSPELVAAESLRSRGVARLRELGRAAALEPGETAEIFSRLHRRGAIVVLTGDPEQLGPDSLLADARHWEALSSRALDALESFHARFPLRTGMPREELRSRMGLDSAVFGAAVEVMANSGLIDADGALLAKGGYSVRFSPDQERRISELDRRLSGAGFAPPALTELNAEFGAELVDALVARGDLVPVGSDLAFRAADFAMMEAGVREWIEARGSITVADFRDRFETSRKFALAVLEHFDAAGLTIREGDVRRLKNQPS